MVSDIVKDVIFRLYFPYIFSLFVFRENEYKRRRLVDEVSTDELHQMALMII